jgi:hypothetical protein
MRGFNERGVLPVSKITYIQNKTNREERMTRYSDTGNDDDGYLVDEILGRGRGREPKEEDADCMDAIKGIGRDFKNLKEKHQKALAKAYEKSMKKREAKAKWEQPGNGRIQVRREGLLARPNPQDKKRANASKANTDRAILNAQVVTEQGEFARSGKRFIMGVMEDVIDMDNDASDELRPIGQALTNIINEELTGTFTESLTMIGEQGFKENALATKPGQDES